MFGSNHHERGLAQARGGLIEIALASCALAAFAQCSMVAKPSMKISMRLMCASYSNIQSYAHLVCFLLLRVMFVLLAWTFSREDSCYCGVARRPSLLSCLGRSPWTSQRERSDGWRNLICKQHMKHQQQYWDYSSEHDVVLDDYHDAIVDVALELQLR